MGIKSISLGVTALILSTSVNAATIGSFQNTGYLHFDPFNGGNGYFGYAIDSLANNGHTFSNLSAGEGVASNLTNIDAVYLPTGTTTYRPSDTDLSLVSDYLASGGNVIVQADHNTYDSAFLSQFGVSVSCCDSGNISSIIVSNDITNGPYGTVSTLDAGGIWSISLNSGGTILDSLGSVALLSAGNGLALGSGNLIVLGDINMLDGPGNSGGFLKEDNGVLFQNAIEYSVSAVPVPAAVWLFGSGLLGLVGVARRKKS